MLEGKSIVLGVTGSIAAYKAIDIASQLTQLEAKVDVLISKEAKQFVTPLIFRAITGRPVFSDMFDATINQGITHVSLAEAADVIVIAPTTANTIAKLANGIADDIVCSTVLASKSPIILAPAMNVNMFENSITQENLCRLKNRGFIIVGPDSGRLASGAKGKGRFSSSSEIIGTICQVLATGEDLANKYVLVTAGATQESIDPVRYITNHSSGKMGYALAEAARDRGAKVKLITAPTALNNLVGVETENVTTAEEMYQAVKKSISLTDVLIMAAAVSDYLPETMASEKIKKKNQELKLNLRRTIDILSNVNGDFIKVGFAAESSNLIENAKKKLVQKKLDIIVANDITVKDSGFGSDNNRVIIISSSGEIDALPLMPKRKVADEILNRVLIALSK
jgi:phosphopantothenoylcysteine decarboxylase/phosphopantothenate--cysteine ligase